MELATKTVISKIKIRNFLALVGIILLVIIPKGGFKISGVPITWGYLYLGFIAGGILLSVNKYFTINQKTLLCYIATLPFVIYFTIHLAIKGYDGTIGNLIAFYVSFVFMPFLFLLLLPRYLKKINLDYIENLIYRSVVIVSAYGIFLFVYKQVFGSYIEIPYFTINAGDVGELGEKYNRRGDIFKLTSTYNNGNIFGVCLLMLLPVFYKKHKRGIEMFIVILALFLTLSRTVWIGIILFFLIQYRNQLLKLIKIYAFIIILLFFLGSIVLTSYFQYGSLGNFLTDTSFGGRIYQIREAFSISLFGVKPYVIIDEIVYLSIYKQFGIIGLILFCISFFMPLYISLNSPVFKNTNYILGIFIYLVICASDGCMLLLPTLAFFYFIVCMAFITQNRAKQQDIT